MGPQDGLTWLTQWPGQREPVIRVGAGHLPQGKGARWREPGWVDLGEQETGQDSLGRGQRMQKPEA